MSEDDYKAGMRGDDFSPMMNREDFDAGKSVHKSRQAILGSGDGPKTTVDGVGFTGVMMAPFLAIMYPIAGSLSILLTAVTYFALNFIPQNLKPVQFVLTVLAFFFAMAFAIKLEHKASNFKAYRVSRHVLRLALIGVYVFGLIIGVNRYTGYEQSFNSASGGTIFFGLVAIAALAWLFPKFDRIFFPVMDDKAKAEVKKFAGMDEGEVFSVKKIEYHNKRRFFMAWLVLSVVLGVIFRKGVPVVLILLASYFICRAFRKKFEIPLPQTNTAP